MARIRLTVLYDLPEGADVDEFIEWRLTEHQKSNESIPGVVRTDFARITRTWPEGSLPHFRFQTVLEWPDRETFEQGFYAPDVQTQLQENLKKLGNYAFAISEILVNPAT